MTRLEFFFDPSCPFCWITSRWLLRVQPHREIDVTWRPFSLALKNDELDGDEDAKSPHGDIHRIGHRVLRVIRAAERQGASPIELYNAFGTRFHLDRVRDETLVPQVIDELGLSRDLLDAADDASLDADLAAELEAGLEAAGQDVGVPLIVFVDDKGERRGYFGPVLAELPDLDDSLKIWDGLSALGQTSSFYELKRQRRSGAANVESTAGA